MRRGGCVSDWLAMLHPQDWAGAEGEARYPAFLNPKAWWPIEDPNERAILQQHDVAMLRECLYPVAEGKR